MDKIALIRSYVYGLDKQAGPIAGTALEQASAPSAARIAKHIGPVMTGFMANPTGYIGNMGARGANWLVEQGRQRQESRAARGAMRRELPSAFYNPPLRPVGPQQQPVQPQSQPQQPVSVPVTDAEKQRILQQWRNRRAGNSIGR